MCTYKKARNCGKILDCLNILEYVYANKNYLLGSGILGAVFISTNISP
jgi:hypothetical protein